MRVNIGLAQIYPKLGDLPANLDKHLEMIEAARHENVDLLVFPELSLTGYQLQDLVPEVAMRADESDPTFKRLLDESNSMDMVIGFVQSDDRNRFYTSSAYLSQGKCVHVHQKIYLPTYAMFDEGRYFDQGEHVRAFDTRFGRVGMLICEDFWHMSPAYLLWLDGADMFIFHSASPLRGLDSNDRVLSSRWVELVNQAYGSMFTSYIIHCNRVGYEDGKNFWGGSSIVDPNGDLMLHGHYFEEKLMTQTIDLKAVNRTRARLPLLRDERPELILRELKRIMGE